MSAQPNKPIDPKQILAAYSDPKDAIKRVEALKRWREYSERLVA